MRFEEVLPEIRKGRKARRKDCPMADLAPGDKYLDLTVEDVLADDWQLVPGPKKYSCYIGLFEDGGCVTSDTREGVPKYVRLYEQNIKPSKPAKLVEVRKIEWEVSGEA